MAQDGRTIRIIITKDDYADCHYDSIDIIKHNSHRYIVVRVMTIKYIQQDHCSGGFEELVTTS